MCSLMVRRTTIAGNCRFMDEVLSAYLDSSMRMSLPLRAYRHVRLMSELLSDCLDSSTKMLAIESLPAFSALYTRCCLFTWIQVRLFLPLRVTSSFRLISEVLRDFPDSSSYDLAVESN